MNPAPASPYPDFGAVSVGRACRVDPTPTLLISAPVGFGAIVPGRAPGPSSDSPRVVLAATPPSLPVKGTSRGTFTARGWIAMTEVLRDRWTQWLR